MANNVKIIYNNQSYSFPIIEGSENEKAIDIKQLRSKTGFITYDPGYKNTGHCISNITYLDGENGILRYRGYSIDELCKKTTFLEVCYLLIFEELPTKQQLDKFQFDINEESLVDEHVKEIFQSFPKSAHPMCVLSSLTSALIAFSPENETKLSLKKSAKSENDQKLAIAVQKEVNSSNTSGLANKINKIGSPLPIFISGGSDDIGDISWKVPTVTLRFPSNIPGLQGHHWSNSIAMATPIAHKGANAGAKVLAMTILDFLLKPDKLTQAKDYFENVQKEETEYRPMISENDPPATFLNKDIMEQYKSRLKEFYFDETKYETYLEQLGIDYPVIKKD